ncbi:MAG: DUF4185 domain-containing protein [Acidobacteria bacterium]|nr:DUF4185 domain-containing protein [Acidobacteriota bacterium]
MLAGLLSIPGAPLRAQSSSVRYVPGSSQKICQLTGELDRERQQFTLNRTESRFGIWGTDLGASFEHDGRIYFLFGDTIGRRRGDGGDLLCHVHLESVQHRAHEVHVGAYALGGMTYVECENQRNPRLLDRHSDCPQWLLTGQHRISR